MRQSRVIVWAFFPKNYFEVSKGHEAEGKFIRFYGPLKSVRPLSTRAGFAVFSTISRLLNIHV